jgi:protein SCO1
MKCLAIALAIATGLSVACFSCGPSANQPENHAQARRFVLKGKVTLIDKQRQQVVVDHEAIPGFMGAMEMPYPVKDAQSLDQIAPGDEIRADLVVTDGHAALENIVVTKKGEHRLEIPKPSGVN